MFGSKSEIVNEIYALALSKNILITRDAIEFILFNGLNLEKVKSVLENKECCFLHIDDLKQIVEEREEDKAVEILPASSSFISKNYGGKVERVWNFNTDFESKTSVDNFLNYFRDRYKKMKSLLMQRNGIKNIVSVEKLLSYKLNEDVSVIAIIREKHDRGKGDLKFLIEDDTGEIFAFVDESIYDVAKNIVEDDVVAFKGRLTASKKYFIIKEVFYPDIPLPTNDSISKINDPLTAAFISDLHFGSAQFIEKAMHRFFKWLHSDDSDAQRLKYLFILGDNVDGVGIYPDQEKELVMKNIYDQYKAFEDFLLKYPST